MLINLCWTQGRESLLPYLSDVGWQGHFIGNDMGAILVKTWANITLDKGNHLRYSMIENGTSVLLSRSTSSSSKFKVVIVSSKTKKRFWRTVKPVLFCCFAIIGLIIGRRSEGNEVDDWSPRFSEHIEWKKVKYLKKKGLWNQIHCFLGVISCVNFY